MRLLYTFLFLTFFQFSGAQTTWTRTEISYKDALVKAKNENKSIFIMLYATWCPHCNVMKATVFSDADVIDFLNKNYVCVWADIDKEEGTKLKDKFQTRGLPAFLFLDNNETLLYSIAGEMKTQGFKNEVKTALNPTMQLPYLEKQFLDDPSNANKCLAYIQTIRKGAPRTALSQPSHIYLETQTDQQLISETNWRVISNGVSDIESREFQYVLKHKKDFEKVSSADRVDRKITSMVTELLEPYTQTLDSVGYFQKRKIARTIQLQETDALIFSYDLKMAERTLNWGLYKKTTFDGVQKYVWNSDNKLKEIGQVYLKEINDVEALKKAITWVNRALELNNSADGNLLLSRLYLKIKDKKSALKYAQNAKIISAQMGWITKDADDLIKELNSK